MEKEDRRMLIRTFHHYSLGRQTLRSTVALLAVLASWQVAGAQTTTYHLHREGPLPLYLRTAGPDSAASSVASATLKNAATGEYKIVDWLTDVGVPSAEGTISAGTTVTFNIWMAKDANFGSMFPRAKLFLNGATGTQLCTSTGTTQLSRTVTKFTLTCQLSSSVSMGLNDRLYLWVGINLTAGPGAKDVFASVYVEGTAGGQYDSTVAAPQPVPPPPPPRVTSLSPASGLTGTVVTIAGSTFGASQGTSTIKFNGVTANPSSWATNQIVAPVPASATTGQVLVTVNGTPSNGVTFLVFTTGSISGVVSRTSNGAAISGATVDALQSGVVKASATTAPSGTYTLSGLTSGAYDLRVQATGFLTEIRTGVSTGGGGTITVNVGLSVNGAISGAVTMSDGVTPIAGAAVSVADGPAVVGSSLTDGNGNFTINGLRAGTYTANANAPGYESRVQSGVTVTEGATTPLNVSLNTATVASIRFVYDEIGRLRSVSDLGGDTATYAFDATGNIMSIERHSSSAVSISEVTPDRGATGTAVIIYGTGFSQTPVDNTVSFNGTAATVTAATTTQLAVSVPPGAGSGLISVTTPSGSASSPQPFTVGSSLAPTVTGFSPTMGVAGTAVTINGMNFSDVAANNAVRFDVTGASVTSAGTQAITTAVPSTARSGHVSVATAAGIGTSAGYFIIPPAPFTVSDVDSVVTLQAGTPTPVTISTATKVALAMFDGIGGRRAALGVQSTFSGCVTITMYDVQNNNPRPDGQGIYDPMSTGLCGNSIPFFIDTWSLPFTGAYTILMDPDSTQVGSVTLTLYDVPPDVRGTAAMDGTQVTVNTPSVGQNAQYTFAGIANHRVSFWYNPINNICNTGSAWILQPNTDYSNWASCKSLLVQTLPVTGTYRVFVNPVDGITGASSFTLWDVPADPTGSVTIGGQAAGVTIGTPGQNGSVTFSGATGQQVTVHVTGSSMGCTTVTLMNGTTQLTSAWSCSAAFNLPTQTLPASTTYTISIHPDGTNTGSMNVSVTSP